jgi:hypothetical protein
MILLSLSLKNPIRCRLGFAGIIRPAIMDIIIIRLARNYHHPASKLNIQAALPTIDGTEAKSQRQNL